MKDQAIQAKSDHANDNPAPAASPQGAAADHPGYGIPFLDRQRPPNRTGLPDQLKAGVEALSGYAMDDVRVHYGSSKPAELGALAYTQATNIYVGPGQEEHVPHEAWHVVQQKQGRVKPTLQMKGVAINDEEGLEREADVMGKTSAVYLQRSAGNHEHDGSTQPAIDNGLRSTAVQRKPAMGIDTKSALVTYDDQTGKIIEEQAIRFGNLSNDCGTRIDGWIYPNSNIHYGGQPSVQPSWWENLRTDAEKAKPGAKNWISNYVVQGHLINDNLGGPGNDMRNLTPIAKGCNSHHSAKVEADVKKWVNNHKNIAHYVVSARYTNKGPDSSWFDGWIPAKYLKLFPKTLKIVHEEYDAGTRKFIHGYDTEITNAIKGKG